jgi:hypothetical protein
MGAPGVLFSGSAPSGDLRQVGCPKPLTLPDVKSAIADVSPNRVTGLHFVTGAGTPTTPDLIEITRKTIISSGEYNVYSGILMAAVEQYVIDENGNKVAVILPLTEYQHLKEDLHDLAMVAERRDEGTISLTEMKKRVM